MPWADALYGCDLKWWRLHGDKFSGEKWSTHSANNFDPHMDDKSEAVKWGVNLVRGRAGEGFSFDPGVIHYGSNSGFQAINLAILKGAKTIVLVGFDMRRVEGEAHFFGEHPEGLARCADYGVFLPDFARAAKTLNGVRVVNTTKNSALTCFEKATFYDEIWRNCRLYRHRPDAHAGAN